jgi:hypothetical protein
MHNFLKQIFYSEFAFTCLSEAEFPRTLVPTLEGFHASMEDAPASLSTGPITSEFVSAESGLPHSFPPTDMPHPSVPTRLLYGIALAAYIISPLYSLTPRLSYSV